MGSNCKTLLHLILRILSTHDYGCHIYSPAFSYIFPAIPLLIHLDNNHPCSLCFAMGAFRSSPFGSHYVESGLPSLSQRPALSLSPEICTLSSFTLSKLTPVSSLLPTFASSPRLPSPFSLLSHSPSPHLKHLPFSTNKYLHWVIIFSCICSSVFADTPKFFSLFSQLYLNPLLQYSHLYRWL